MLEILNSWIIYYLTSSISTKRIHENFSEISSITGFGQTGHPEFLYVYITIDIIIKSMEIRFIRKYWWHKASAYTDNYKNEL